MATKTGDKADSCTFLWKIENIRRCWWKHRDILMSPTFIADALGGTKWSLKLYPNGYHFENEIVVYLYKKKDRSGLDEAVVVDFELGFLSQNGELNGSSYSDYAFTKGVRGFGASILHKTVFDSEREDFLPNGTLTVQCTVWSSDMYYLAPIPVNPQNVFARTAFKENRRSFYWTIDRFSTLKSGQINKFKEEVIDFDVTFDEGQDAETKLVININSFNKGIKFFSFKTSIVDKDGGKEDCGSHEYFSNDLKKGIKCIVLLPKKCIINKSRYLPNDVLSLDCEYMYSAVEYEHCCSGMISPKSPNKVVKSRNEPDIVEEESLLSAVILTDLKFADGIFSDTELCTSTKTFPAHKAILSARSPVFRRMFSNYMKEKNIRQVYISDCDDDSIHRMLLYFYTDSLENLHFESALKLYRVADKYEILSLKNRCASVLKDNLCSTNVCEVLILSDLQHDEFLKNGVQDYILDHDKAVFCAQEWKDFMNTHLKLAADIMYRAYQ